MPYQLGKINGRMLGVEFKEWAKWSFLESIGKLEAQVGSLKIKKPSYILRILKDVVLSQRLHLYSLSFRRNSSSSINFCKRRNLIILGKKSRFGAEPIQKRINSPAGKTVQHRWKTALGSQTNPKVNSPYSFGTRPFWRIKLYPPNYCTFTITSKCYADLPSSMQHPITSPPRRGNVYS